MLCNIGTSSLENAAKILFYSPSDYKHHWRYGEELERFPRESYPRSEKKWRSIQADVDHISATLDSQYQACRFMGPVLISPFRMSGTAWDPLRGDTTQEAQVDWYGRHQELLRRDCPAESPMNGGVTLQYDWKYPGAAVVFQVAVRLVYPCPPDPTSVFIVDIFDQKTMPVYIVERLYAKANAHAAWLDGKSGSEKQFECHTRDAHAPEPVVNPWLPSYPEPSSGPRSLASTVYNSAVSTTMGSTSGAASAAPPVSFVGGSTLSSGVVYAPRPGTNPSIPSYPESQSATVATASSLDVFSRASGSLMTASTAPSTLSGVSTFSAPSASKRKRRKPKRERPPLNEASGDKIDKMIAEATRRRR
jgi:hypothetical protein